MPTILQLAKGPDFPNSTFIQLKTKGSKAMFFSKKVAAMNEAEDEPASCVNCRQPVESQAGLIRVWLKSRAYLQMLPHTNIISSVPRNHYPLVHFFFLSSFRPPAKSRRCYQMKEQMTVTGRRGPRNEKYEWQKSLKQISNRSHTLLQVTSC